MPLDPVGLSNSGTPSGLEVSWRSLSVIEDKFDRAMRLWRMAHRTGHNVEMQFGIRQPLLVLGDGIGMAAETDVLHSRAGHGNLDVMGAMTAEAKRCLG